MGREGGEWRGYGERMGWQVPRVDVPFWRENELFVLLLLLEKLLEFQKVWLDNVVLEIGEPALVQRVDLEFQEVFLLVRECGDPFVFVEFLGCFVFGGAEEGGYAAVGFGLFGVVAGGVRGFALEAHGCCYAEDGEGD